MEVTEYRSRYDPTEPLDRAMDWSVLAQRKMSTSLIVIRQIRLKESPWVGVPEDDHVIEALTADASQKPFAHGVHQRRLNRRKTR